MAHAQISEAESASGEMLALREERDLVRAPCRNDARTARRADAVGAWRNDDAERVVPVVIQGQRYPVRSTLEPSYVAELAAYVDEKMRWRRTRTTPTIRSESRSWPP